MGGGVGGMVYSIRNGTIIFSHANHRGDIIARSNLGGSLTSFALYEAYGTRPEGGTGDPDRQKANTKEEETDLGLLNEGMRFRDLETGTFLTRDPIGYQDGPNVYCYVHCNPITSFDPWGLETQSESKDAAQEAFDNGDIDYDPDDYDNFDDWWEDKEYSWYSDRAEQGYNIFSDNYEKQIRKADSKAQKELFSQSASTAMKEKLEILAHSGVLAPSKTDSLKDFVDKHVNDGLNNSEQYLNFSKVNWDHNTHNGIHGFNDTYEIYMEGTDFLNMNPKDLYTLILVSRGYTPGAVILFGSCDAAGYNERKTSVLAKQGTGGVYASEGDFSDNDNGVNHYFLSNYGWSKFDSSGKETPLMRGGKPQTRLNFHTYKRD